MTTEVIAQPLQAGVQATFGQGRVLYIKTATSPLTIIAETQNSASTVRKFLNVSAGFKVSLDKGDAWTYLRVTSALTQNVELLIGDDDVEIANAVTVSGGVFTQETPKSVLTDRVTVVTAAGAHTLAAANAGRRSVTIFSDPANPETTYVRSAGGANRIGFVQPGMSVEFDGTYGLDYDAPAGGSTLYIFEES